MFAYTMRFANKSTPPLTMKQQCVLPLTVAVLHNSKGQHIGTFDDVVDLLHALPSYDPRYACSSDFFQIKSTMRSYSIGLDLDDIIEAVNNPGKWRITICDVRDLICSNNDDGDDEDGNI
ncbi:hypothetical protein HAP94_18710 [Acidithiobacillus ferrivorans]|nr:hypothetical protein [Acidithiobacillus ferrivorans]